MNTRSEELNELAAALCAAQAEFGAVPKQKDNQFFKSKYADLATVVTTAAPIVAKHGLAVSQFLGFDETGADTLTTWLLHKSGQFISESMRLHLPKQDAQGQGSATTYGRRFAYMAALGLVADVDDDGNKASAASSQASSGQSNGSDTPEPTATPARATERPASAKQRGLIFARAAEHHMPASVLANVVLVSNGAETREFESEDDAQGWLKRALDRLPASRVDLVLKNLLAEAMP